MGIELSDFMARPFSQLMRKKRQTGRTTRMVELAEQLAKQGRAVYILCGSVKDASWLQRRIDDQSPGFGIKCERVPKVFDWQSMTIPGAHSDCVFLVEHWAIEQHFEGLLKMWCAFDRPEVGNVERLVMPKYRLVGHGEVINLGDQCLGDDCETWVDISGAFIGMKWNAFSFQPARRAV